MVLVKANTQTMNAADIVQYSDVVLKAMNANTNFADPTPPLATVGAARTALLAAIPEAAYGDRVKVALRNTLRKTLAKLMVDLCRYVNSASNGDRDVALTSGLQAAKIPVPTPLVEPPFGLTAQPTSKNGEALVRYRTHYGSRTKQIYATSVDPNVESGWALVGVTTKSSFLVSNLESGKLYWFKVNAVCASGVSGYSDPAVVRAA